MADLNKEWEQSTIIDPYDDKPRGIIDPYDEWDKATPVPSPATARSTAPKRYTVQDKTTGQKVTFDWNDPNPPTDADMEQVFAEANKSAPSAPTSRGGLTPMSFVRPALEIGGMTAGGLLGTPAGPLGTVGGAGLGYGMGKGVADLIEGKQQPSTVSEALLKGGKDVGTGMLTEITGQVGGALLGKGLEYAGKFGKQAIGKLTGAGTGAAEEAYKGGQAFTDAMRGKTSPDDLVSSARQALSSLKETRASAYREQLANLPKAQEIDITPIQSKTVDLMKKYGVRVEADGTLDMSRTAIGSKGNKDIEGVVATIRSWGSKPGDKSAVGLDTLKRQLDDFYSESGNARGFVAALRNEVKSTITKSVPEYSQMTKGYSEATSLIKDVESSLMLRKQGMSGRITSDQTLRRLTSAMKDNFELRRDLVNIMGNQAGIDLAGQVAGHAMSPLMPRGMAGVPINIAGLGASIYYLNPKFWPIIAASSPRVAGEFLKYFGKGSAALPGASIAAGKAAAYLTVPPAVNR